MLAQEKPATSLVDAMIAAGAATVVFASVASDASASLVIDMRAVSTTAGHVLDAKTVFFTGTVGDTVTMEAHGRIFGNNQNPNDEGLISVAGSFLSTTGDLAGNLIAKRNFWFTGVGGSNGLVQDLDGDGDLDVGSNNNASAANFFAARTNHTPEPVFGDDLVFGTVTWTYTGGGGFDTSVNFRPRISGTAASWFEDGSQITSSNFTSGPAVLITLPEPVVASLLPMLASGLLARRRSGISKH